MKNNDIAEVSLLITKDLSLDDQELVQLSTTDQLKSRLTQVITYLLDKDFERLLRVMYRIDINEEKLKAALASNPPEDIAPNIAQLILERELQKVQTRRKYSS